MTATLLLAVLMQLPADVDLLLTGPATATIGDVLAWEAVLTNGLPETTANARVEAEYTAPDGERVTQTAISPLAYSGALATVELRVYPVPGTQFVLGENEWAIDGTPSVPLVRVGADGKLHLYLRRTSLPSGASLTVQYTMTVVGLIEAPDGRIVMGAATVFAPPPPPF